MKTDEQRLAETAHTLVRIARTLPEQDRQKDGGCLFIVSGDLSDRHLIQVGHVPLADKLEKYSHYAQEKALRTLANYHLDPEGTLSSWQSRDEPNDRYGGAVLFRGPGNIIRVASFSGLSELADEGLSLIVGRQLLGLGDNHQVEEILKVSNNRVIYPRMLTAYRAAA